MMICCSVVFSYVLDFRSRIVFGRKLPWYVDDLAYIVAGCCLLAARVMAMSSSLSFISLSHELARAWWLLSLDRIRKRRLCLLPLRRSFQVFISSLSAAADILSLPFRLQMKRMALCWTNPSWLFPKLLMYGRSGGPKIALVVLKPTKFKWGIIGNQKCRETFY